VNVLLSSAVDIIRNQQALSPVQKAQFRQIIVQGLRGKFTPTLREDTAAMLRVVDIWIRYGFLPMSETYSAVDPLSGDVLAILLLNDFKKPGALDSGRCLAAVMRAIGPRRALRIAFHFLRIDNLNKQTQAAGAQAEIYLVATREDVRGKGVGTALMRRVLDDLTGAATLLVFEKNPARRLYERLGFTQTARLPTPEMTRAFGDEYDVLVRMERRP